uniref:Uncharacterized protein n=1 Tax=Ixodes ricinus TaxID=34613 RepID=A0A6B0V4U1_IXORI
MERETGQESWVRPSKELCCAFFVLFLLRILCLLPVRICCVSYHSICPLPRSTSRRRNCEIIAGEVRVSCLQSVSDTSRWHRRLGRFVDWLAVVASSRPSGPPVSSTHHRHFRFLTRPRLCGAAESSKLIALSTLPIGPFRGAEGMSVGPAFLTRTFSALSIFGRGTVFRRLPEIPGSLELQTGFGNAFRCLSSQRLNGLSSVGVGEGSWIAETNCSVLVFSAFVERCLRAHGCVFRSLRSCC